MKNTLVSVKLPLRPKVFSSFLPLASLEFFSVPLMLLAVPPTLVAESFDFLLADLSFDFFDSTPSVELFSLVGRSWLVAWILRPDGDTDLSKVRPLITYLRCTNSSKLSGNLEITSENALPPTSVIKFCDRFKERSVRLVLKAYHLSETVNDK